MSIKIMTMVFDRYPTGGGEMLLALALADHAHDDGTKVFPFIKSLAEKTRQSVRSVQYQLRKMEESGWLILVNAGNGGRGQSNEYRINPDWVNGADFAPIKRVQSETEKGAIHDTKGANDDTKGCNPLHPHITVIEPSVTVNKPSSTPAARVKSLSSKDLTVLGVERQVATEFLALRKRKRAPLTELALAGIRREADRVGWTLDQVLRKCVERGWQGFEASWVKDEKATGAKHGNFGQQDYYDGVAADGSF